MKLFKSKLISDVAANTLEKIFYLTFNLIYLFIISIYLDKEYFGIYNWTNSISYILMLLITFGFSPVITRYVSEDINNIPKIVSSTFAHTLILSILSLILYLVIEFIFKIQYSNFLLLSILVSLIGNLAFIPRQILVGLENYWIISKTRILGTAIKLFFGVGLLFAGFNIYALYFAMFLDNLINLSLWYFIKNSIKKASFDVVFYKKLLKESIPLIGVIAFDYSISRLDWIMLGSYKSAAIVAEYSFAYRVYEFTWLPHVILGSILIPKFIKIKEDSAKLNSILSFLTSVSFIIPIFLFISWTPLIDFLTSDKYGSVNQETFFILIFVSPLLAAISFFWNLAITKRKSKQIFIVTFIAALLNSVLNFILIPQYGNIGAAITNSITVIMQFSLYLYYFKEHKRSTLTLMLKIYVSSLFIGIINIVFPGNLIAAAFASVFYLIMMILLKTFNYKLILSYIK